MVWARRLWDSASSSTVSVCSDDDSRVRVRLILQVFCLLLELLLGFRCPAPPPHQPQPEYAQTFKNLTCASQDNSYQTFGLVDTVGGTCLYFHASSECLCCYFRLPGHVRLHYRMHFRQQ